MVIVGIFSGAACIIIHENSHHLGVGVIIHFFNHSKEIVIIWVSSLFNYHLVKMGLLFAWQRLAELHSELAPPKSSPLSAPHLRSRGAR